MWSERRLCQRPLSLSYLHERRLCMRGGSASEPPIYQSICTQPCATVCLSMPAARRHHGVSMCVWSEAACIYGGSEAAWWHGVLKIKCVMQVEFLSNGSHVGSDKWVMAPLAELLNHQPFSGHIQWQDNDVSSGVFQIISDRDYLAGEQVLRYSYDLPSTQYETRRCFMLLV